jgi:hypothetical protein
MTKYIEWLMNERAKALKAELEATERRKEAILAELNTIAEEKEKGAAPQ